jgi:hypothetical protein
MGVAAFGSVFYRVQKSVFKNCVIPRAVSEQAFFIVRVGSRNLEFDLVFRRRILHPTKR